MNLVSQDDLHALLRQIPTATTVDLSGKSMGVADAALLANVLSQNPPLTSLELGDNLISSEGASLLADVLAGNFKLTYLGLRSNGLEARGAGSLATLLKDNTTLKRLDLSGNDIRPEGAAVIADAFAKNKSLTAVDLSGNDMQDIGTSVLMDALKNNFTLRTLAFRDNRLESEGVEVLAENIQENPTMTDLQLGGNDIGSDGAILLAEALKSNSKLLSLSLRDNNIPASGLSRLCETLKSTKDWHPRLSPPAFNLTLTSLDVSYNSIGSGGAGFLGDVLLREDCALTALDLTSTDLTPTGIRLIADGMSSNTAVIDLRLSNNFVNFFAAEPLAKILRTNGTLTSLSVQNTFAADYCTAPSQMQVEAMQQAFHLFAAGLAGNRTLTSLHLARNQITDKGAASLVAGLNGTATMPSIFAAAPSPASAHGAAGDASSTDADAASRGHAGKYGDAVPPPSESAMVSLDLQENSLGEGGAEIMADFLIESGDASDLTNLNMGSNYIGEEGAEVLAEMLGRNTTLTICDFSDNSFGAEGAALLGQAMVRNSTLTKLNL